MTKKCTHNPQLKDSIF